jgi:hypothetical protein
MAIALWAVVLVAGVGVYISTRSVAPDDAQQPGAAARKDGIVNPGPAAAGMKTLAMPRLSDARFEPPPTITTGTYTDPRHRKPADPKARSSAR